MKVFIWTRVGHATGNWHDEGGIVAVAEDIETARHEIAKECPENCEALTASPDQEYTLTGPTERAVFVFPDAGCC